ncbi:SCO family protein [Streptomyces sp. NPDC096354]|uniref:SCO family protein n=1 Tax=Streptomyces sp. NPDC096354 TaxID=3366088 RepID=UPI0037F1B6A6
MTASAPVPSFSLVDHDDRPVTVADYQGRWLVVFFGFTHCRMVCPRALGRLTAALDRLGDRAAAIQPLYITVDPDRDTPTVMREFLRSYPRFTGLTGSTEQIGEAKEAFRVFTRRTSDPEDPEGYAVPHTAITYLISPEGAYADSWTEALDSDQIADRLRAHVPAGESL